MGRLFVACIAAGMLTSTALTQPPPPASPFGNTLSARAGDALPEHLVRRIGTPRMDHAGGCAVIAISADERWLAVGERSMTNRAYVWDLKTGTPKWILEGHNNWIARMRFSPDGEHLLVSHHADSLMNFPLPNEMIVWKVQTGEVVKHHAALDWSLAANGKFLALARPNPDDEDEDGKGKDREEILARIRFKGFTVDVVEFPSHKPYRTIVHPTKHPNSVALSPDGSLLAVGTNNEIAVYDIAKRQDLPVIKGLKDHVHLLRFSPDGKTLVSVSDDLLPATAKRRSVQLWDPRTGKSTGAFEVEDRWYTKQLDFRADGNLHTDFGIWNLESRKKIKLAKRFDGTVYTLFNKGKSLAHNADPKYGWAGKIQFADFETGEELSMPGAGAALMPWEFSADGKTLFTRCNEKHGEPELVQAWDVATGKELPDQRRREKVHAPKQDEIFDAGDGRTIRFKNLEHRFDIFDAKTAQVLFNHKIVCYPAWSVSADRKRLAIFDVTQFRVVDLSTFADIKVFPSVSQGIREYLFSPDGATLAATSYDGTMRLYDVATGEKRLERAGVGNVVFAPDGRTFATNNLIGSVDLISLTK
jgi:WD40 repeat protein